MKHEEGFFQGIRGTRIYHQSWLPEGEPRAALLIVHGLGEHSGRYANVVDHLVPLGYALYAFDHVGHGKSDGAREYVERFEELTETLERYRGIVQQAHPDKPLFLYGHSLGALIVPFYLLEGRDGLAGAVLSAPMVCVPDHVSAMTVLLGRVLSRLLPKAGVVSVDPTGLSRDLGVVDAYVNDPLVFHSKTPARLAAEMLRAMERVTAEAGNITLPLLLLQAGADSLVNPRDARFLHDAVSSEDKTLKVYDGLYHEVHNEPERASVLQDIEAWLAARV